MEIIRTFLNHLFGAILLLSGGLASLYESYVLDTLSPIKQSLFLFGSILFLFMLMLYIILLFKELKKCLMSTLILQQ